MEIKPFIMENIDSSIMPISFLNRKIWTFVKIIYNWKQTKMKLLACTDNKINVH